MAQEGVIAVWAVLLVGMAVLGTFATLVLFALWRADDRYRTDHHIEHRGWLAKTMTIGSIMTLVPSWYFALTLTWRIANDLDRLPEWMTPISVLMVIMALGSPVYLAVRVLTVRRSTGEPPPWDHV